LYSPDINVTGKNAFQTTRSSVQRHRVKEQKAIGCVAGNRCFAAKGNDLLAITNAVALGTAMTAPLSLDLYIAGTVRPTPRDKAAAAGVFRKPIANRQADLVKLVTGFVAP